MINRTIDTSYSFKINNTTKIKPELDTTDKGVKTNKKNLSPYEIYQQGVITH